MTQIQIRDLELKARKIRTVILEMIYRTKAPHIASSFSIVEILMALYFKYLKIDARYPCAKNRDRFILSKGHGCPALYAVLAERGFLDKRDLREYSIDGGSLEQHPRINIKKGIEVSTGSLGHGLSVGAGMAFAAKRDKAHYKIYVLLSDGELNEGSTWEAAMFAPHHHLDNLIAIVDYNKMQALGFTKDILNLEPLADKWRAFGWNVYEVDGHDFSNIFSVFKSFRSSNRPSVFIAHTIKGKGVSFMENNLLWHYRAPNDKEYFDALKELSGER